jgi:signal transduction histidine kinase
MPDFYHVPAFILTALLLPAFGYLYRRFRDMRSLLWFLGFLFALVRMALLYHLGSWDFSNGFHPWLMATSESSALLSSALFLGSLSPLSFRLGKVRVLYVIPYTVPLIALAILFYGVFRGVAPSGPLFMIFPSLGILALVAGIFWNRLKGHVPIWVGLTVCVLFGGTAMWLVFGADLHWALVLVETANHLMTALLLIYVFRRFSPGVVLGTLGFGAWALSILPIFQAVTSHPAVALNLVRTISMAKVVAAIGMIMLALEDELAKNKAAKERERRARLELEAYGKLILSRRRVEDFDRQGEEICRTVAEHSRFSQAALLLLDSAGQYRVAGSAGLEAATVKALEAMAARIPVSGFLAPGSALSAVNHSQTLKLDLEPWLSPGDDLKRLRFTSVLAVPMTGRSAAEGALLLAGMRKPEEALRGDDLLPVEVLTARLQAVRSQTMMLEKLIDSEKFAGLGQLAGNVTQQLNNPLTVILGYAALLEEAPDISPLEHRGAEAILTEARRMRTTLESLLRFSRPHGDQLSAISVTELLNDMEELHRTEFLHRSIEFKMNIASGLPRVLCQSHQLRQAVLHCLQYAIEAVERQVPAPGSAGTKTVRLEATSEGNRVQILVAHSGPGFLNPERAFDPFVPAQAAGETAGLGLSLCATILRDHNGRASAVNLEPRGAAIILELQAA